MSKIIGIDLGTSNSAAAFMEGNKPKLIPAAEGTIVGGGKAFPSYVAIDKSGNLLVGEPARRQAVANPQNTLTAFKRKMGAKDKITLAGKEYTPPQLSAFVLQKIKKDAEAYLGEKVDEAVITVPAYFDDSQRQATKDAGAIAGLKVSRIINEPTAAALAYGIDKTKGEAQILVFDLGGGTLDVTIMDFGDGVFEVLSTSGDTKLGGTDMDEVILNYIADEFKNQEGVDLRRDAMAQQRLRDAAEKAKIELSSATETEINLPYITADTSGPKHLTMKINRAKLEDLIRPIVEKCRGPLEQALKDAKLKPEDVEKVILVGGPTRMPMVQKLVEDIIGKDKIARGVDPMECVAFGAAVQGAVLSGDVKDVLLLDVIPLTLGIETMGGVRTPLIDRNTTVPTSKTQVFSTASDSQPQVEIHVLQGERAMASDNRTLGRFILDGIPPAPRGVPQVEVTFDVDANGILKVAAKDKATGRSQNITIQDSSALSKDDISRMQQEAEKFAEQDKQKSELISLRNQADASVYGAEKTLRDFKDKIKDEDKKEIEEKMETLKKVKDSDKIEEIKTALDALSQAAQKVGQQMYQQNDAAGGVDNSAPGESSQPNADGGPTDQDKKDGDETVQGEYEEKK